MFRKIFPALSALFLLACGSNPYQANTPTSQQQSQPEKQLSESSDPARYQHEKDFAPLKKIDPDQIADAVPKDEPRTKAGNKSPYMVFGKVYQVLESPEGYKEQGGASWYGLKFHGHQTSNGEIYDINGMTAAHKTLPIPSYVKVTNIRNGRTAIVRVNDRGPFVEGRIIDLSYAAATKLGYIEQGTTDVIVEAITAQQYQQTKTPQPVSNTQAKTVWLQIGAYTQETTALAVRQKLIEQFAWPTQVESGVDQFYRVKVGPVAEGEVAEITTHLVAQGFPAPVKLKQ